MQKLLELMLLFTLMAYCADQLIIKQHMDLLFPYLFDCLGLSEEPENLDIVSLLIAFHNHSFGLHFVVQGRGGFTK